MCHVLNLCVVWIGWGGGRGAGGWWVISGYYVFRLRTYESHSFLSSLGGLCPVKMKKLKEKKK